MNAHDQPNACASCPRTGCTLFSAAPGEQATLCGACAFPHLDRRAGDDADLCAALAAANREIARLTRALLNAHEANEDLYQFTGGKYAAA